jgi:Na+/proline symporter
MVLIPLIGSLIGPGIWLIPALAATIIYPDPMLAHQFGNLKHPHEAAFVAMCLKVMPRGMLGLLLSAMLGATLTSMDAGLNKGVGVFIRSFYLPLVDPKCGEKRLLALSKCCTLVFGVVVVVGFALLVNSFRTVDLFTFVNQLAASLTIPLALPLFFGLFYKKTPGWSAWSTGSIGFAVSIFINFWLKYHFVRWTGPLTEREADNVLLAVTTFGTLTVCAGWFFFTSLFYKCSPLEDRERIEEFWTRLHTPVTERGQSEVQESIYRLLGVLCVVYGCFILMLTLIPNSFEGRMCFVFCGGTILGVGVVLHAVSKKIERRIGLTGVTISASRQ